MQKDLHLCCIFRKYVIILFMSVICVYLYSFFLVTHDEVYGSTQASITFLGHEGLISTT